MNKNWGIPILLLFSCLTIFARFHDSFLQFGEKKLLDAWGDGLKTYTNTIYHVRFDSTYSYFEGMNYPYGEHIMAATELPGVAIALKFINEHIYELSDSQIIDGIHLVLMLSLLLCCLFIFLIFKELSIDSWFAIIVAIGITFLAPQTLRLKGHYGLGVLFILPMIFYLLLKFEQNRHWKWSIWMALAVFISAQFHFYFFGIIAATILLYLTSSCVFKIIRTVEPEKLKIIGNYLSHFLVMIGIPLIFFLFWMILNDPVTDRSPKPFGFLHYRANWEGIFLMRELPFYDWINDNIIKIRPTQFEGRIYIGMVATAFLLFHSLKWIISKFKGGLFQFYLNQQPYLYSLFFTGFLLVLFACAFPFSISGLEFLVDYLGPIQQFRSVGRFGWVFYFAINIIAFVSLFQVISKSKNNFPKYGFIILIIGVLLYESYEFSHLKNYTPTNVPFFNEGEQFSDVSDLDFSKYQAIIPMPYFNIGSNNFIKGAGGFAVQRSFTLGAETGLPVTTAMMTRTSRYQTYKQWQLIAKPYRLPMIFDEYPSEKPLLMVWHKRMKPHEIALYEHLLEGAKLVFDKKNTAMYELPMSIFEKRIEQAKTEIVGALESDSLFQINGFYSTDSLENYVYQNFDSQKSDSIYWGTGAFQGWSTDDNLLFEGKIPHLNAEESYTVALWSYLNKDRFGSAMFVELEEYSPDGIKRQKKKWYLGKESATFDINGWVLSEMTFKPKEKENHFRLTARWNKPDREEVFFDELLIMPSKTTLYGKGEGFIRRNNYWFKK